MILFKRSGEKTTKNADVRDPLKTPKIDFKKDKNKNKTIKAGPKIDREYKVPYIHETSLKKMSHFQGSWKESAA